MTAESDKPKERVATSVRFDVEDQRLIEALQRKTGLRRSGVLKLALRRLATAEGVELEQA